MQPYTVTECVVSGYPGITLGSGALQSTFLPTLGMVCCSFLRDGVELLDQRAGVARYAEKGSTMGIPLLYPWANRLGTFEYNVSGHAVRLDRASADLHFDGQGLPMHGLQPANLRWRLIEATAASGGAHLVTQLDYRLPALLAVFPFPHTLGMDVWLRDETLTVAVTLRPSGDVVVPVSFGFHPYLRLPDVPRTEWWVELPVRRRVVLDARQIPTPMTQPVSIPPGLLGERSFDDGFDRLDTPARFVLAGGTRRITLEFLKGYSFAQVYAPAGESFICFEPMTAATNALVSGRGLSLVEPGGAYTATFTITVERIA